jgi:hypothetical protein
LYCNNIIKAKILVFSLDVPFSSSTKLSRPFGRYLVGTTHPPLLPFFILPKPKEKEKRLVKVDRLVSEHLKNSNEVEPSRIVSLFLKLKEHL